MLPKEFVKTDTSELLYARRLLKLYKIHDIIAEHTNKIILEKKTKKKNTQIRLSATTHDDTQVTMRCDLWVRLHDFLANVTKRPEIFAIIIFYFFLIFCIFFFFFWEFFRTTNFAEYASYHIFLHTPSRVCVYNMWFNATLLVLCACCTFFYIFCLLEHFHCLRFLLTLSINISLYIFCIFLCFKSLSIGRKLHIAKHIFFASCYENYICRDT